MPTLRFVVAWYLVMSLITFCAFGVDKWRAASAQNRRRIPESTLHVLELLGGWPGSLLAQRLIRHKSSKLAYRRVFWLITAVHILGWAWWLLRQLNG
ncbi:MAG: DUF1294 domain-containing protein [Phycisphaerales bacterium]